MAYGKKTGGRPFEKGNKLGKGRKPLPDDIKQIRKVNKQEFERIAVKYLYLSVGELEKMCEDRETTAFDAMIITVILRAINKGDYLAMDTLLSRLIPKDVGGEDNPENYHKILIEHFKDRGRMEHKDGENDA